MGKVTRDTANGGGLSHPLLLILTDIKEREKYRHSNEKGVRVHEEGLFNVLYLYMKCKGALCKPFKAKYFNQRNSRIFGYAPIYGDCPLSSGEIGSAVRYGNREGLLVNRGNERNHRWVFTNKILEV